MNKLGLFPAAMLIVLVTAKEIVAVSSLLTRQQVTVVHDRYASYPRWGYRTASVPRSATVIHYQRVSYRYVNGIVYRPVGRTFVVVPPPAGLLVPTLPVGFVNIMIGGTPFYYHYGTYYVKPVGQQGYKVVPPPVGARVDSLPQGYGKISLDGKTYYVLNGVYYQARVNEKGEVEYEVVGSNVNSL
ncbi:hypothetical protein BN8_02010 [Fibrisoma limi BUZ 3]|uniref:Uncharacterized protein n=1 Tax=Fibrisoma limi BUZ 3 TaxID=1185876 RepID=I2GGD7_9BACT|nr:DUF6515 family protein [Fibrisoma limi]CCH52962.1 hypothetical protein BN8_02010 [Fibrisoma limi BUZ 3]